MKRYVYIFVRQDISPEQQLVQSAHATYKLGCSVSKGHKEIADNTAFVVIGVKNQEALMAASEILSRFSLSYEMFSEEDLNFELTAIATHPLDENTRFPLLAFKTLRFSK